MATGHTRARRNLAVAAAGGASGLVIVALVYVLTQPRAAETAAAPPTPIVVEGSIGSSNSLSVSARQPPLDLAALQATADAVFTRTPSARGTVDEPARPSAAAAVKPVGTPLPAGVKPSEPVPAKPGPAEPAKPAPVEPAKPSTGEPAKPGAPVAKPGVPVVKPAEPVKPAGAPSAAGSPLPEETLEPEPTLPPTRTPTITRTVTETPTSTPTVTLTPIPAPCAVAVPVPELGVGSGFFVTLNHESLGAMAVTWRAPAGGRVLFYVAHPAELPPGDRGVTESFPNTPASVTGSSGGNTLNLLDRPAGQYVALLFNASAQPLPSSEVSVVYLTHGHCP